MSQRNLELVRRVLGEAQHNPAAMWEVLDDEVIWEPPEKAEDRPRWGADLGHEDAMRRRLG